MTKEEKIICKMYLDDLDKTHDCNEYKLLMQMLEQQPCDDCVSRQAVDHLCFEYLRPNTDDNIAFYEHFRDLPPVTPTHGICKDCKNGFQTSFCSSSVYGCEKHKGVYRYDFYCKDFEKRGNLDGSN